MIATGFADGNHHLHYSKLIAIFKEYRFYNYICDVISFSIYKTFEVIAFCYCHLLRETTTFTQMAYTRQ